MIITFIGGGNMAGALVGGLSESSGDHLIRVADPDAEVRSALEADYGVDTFEDGKDAIPGADVVVLAIKPQITPRVMASLGAHLSSRQLLLSVAAGITLKALHGWIGAEVPAVRTMPNAPALLGLGVTGLYADERCTEAHRAQADLVMSACGETVWVKEEQQLDAVTAVSGSGPAYYFLFTEALAAAGESLGLPPDTARTLAVHTARGAGVMAAETGGDVVDLRRRVTSPRGTTAAAIECFEKGGLRTLVQEATEAAARRSRELATGGNES
ncbi:MAG: pyrroline-5-carboxylate reductase [Xanthomonadales bacterium]|jgi:pyrroline-5-carboxylate reductase|nr:pyrroline-5-carboxylate reductase [Xanthomonadales bacterium]